MLGGAGYDNIRAGKSESIKKPETLSTQEKLAQIDLAEQNVKDSMDDTSFGAGYGDPNELEQHKEEVAKSAAKMIQDKIEKGGDDAISYVKENITETINPPILKLFTNAARTNVVAQALIVPQIQIPSVHRDANGLNS